jgi:hypothetical protein
VEQADGAGHSVVTLFVDDLDEQVELAEGVDFGAARSTVT